MFVMRSDRPHAEGPAMRRGIVLACCATAALLLGACGSDDDESQPAERAAPITVKHALGTTRVPANPKRIVVTNPYSLMDYLVALGITPIGSTGDEGTDNPFAPWLAGKAEGVQVIGGLESLKYERILALKPDLILADPWRTEEYKQLTKIAPTVGVPLDYTDYEKEFRYVARLVGREQHARSLIAEQRARLAAFDKAMGSRDPVVSVARMLPDGNKIEGRSYVPTLLKRAGLRRPAAHEKNADGTEFSLEQLRLIDGDVLLVYTGSIAAEAENNEKALEQAQRHPLWDRLGAVRSGNAHFVDSGLWGGGGFLWADAMLKDLERYLLEDAA